MSLRRRLFFLLGGLICLLLVGQWLLFRALSRAVAEDVRTVAFRVGEEILSGFSFRTPGELPKTQVDGPPARDGGAEAPTSSETHVVVVTAAPPQGALGESDRGEAGAQFSWSSTETSAPSEGKQIVVRRELHFSGSPAPTRVEERIEGGTVGEGSGAPGEGAAAVGQKAGEGLRAMVLETDAARDVLLVRGPAIQRRIPIPRDEISTTLDRFGSQLLLGNLALLGIGLVLAAVVAHRLTRPLAGLTAAAERLGRGELGAAVDPSTGGGPRQDEIGRAIQAFNQMSERLAELDRENRRLASVEQLSELGEVARGLAHSLRNPLNALGLAIEQTGASPEVVEGSRRQIRRMDGALRSFLALASAGSAQPESVDLAQLAREVALEALQDGGGRVRIEVESRGAGETPPDFSVSGVPAELKAVLQALVVNAVEASPTGGTVRIRIAPRDATTVGMTIEDEGPGLAASVRERLFEPHVTTKPHGSGMGLFLAHRLVCGRYGGALALDERADGNRGTAAELRVGDRLPAAAEGGI